MDKKFTQEEMWEMYLKKFHEECPTFNPKVIEVKSLYGFIDNLEKGDK